MLVGTKSAYERAAYMVSASPISAPETPAVTKKVLDIGCGRNKIPGAIGVDSCGLAGVDIVHDLDCFPYPLASDSADEIHANHVLEHVHDVLGVMEELWRICKPGAMLYIRVPHATGVLAWRDPTHRRSFTSESLRYFGENEYSYYTHARFEVAGTSLRYRMAQSTRRTRRVLGRIVQWLIDRHPTYAERHLAYLVGGIDEIRFVLKAVKPKVVADANSTHGLDA